LAEKIAKSERVVVSSVVAVAVATAVIVVVVVVADVIAGRSCFSNVR
jgi:hypothetical protein